MNTFHDLVETTVFFMSWRYKKSKHLDVPDFIVIRILIRCSFHVFFRTGAKARKTSENETQTMMATLWKLLTPSVRSCNQRRGCARYFQSKQKMTASFHRWSKKTLRLTQVFSCRKGLTRLKLNCVCRCRKWNGRETSNKNEWKEEVEADDDSRVVSSATTNSRRSQGPSCQSVQLHLRRPRTKCALP